MVWWVQVKKKGRGKHTVKQKQKGMPIQKPHCLGPLTPHQSKMKIEGYCPDGYCLRGQLTWAKSLPDRKEEGADGWARTNPADVLLER